MVKSLRTRDKRTVTIGIRVSPEEMAAIERAAAREYRRVSDFVRVVVLRVLAEEDKPSQDGTIRG